MFSDEHLFKSFYNNGEREAYWIGRLVMSKLAIRKDLVSYIPADTVGLVKGLQGDDTIGYTLVVRWSDGSNCPCYQYDIFSYNKGGNFDKI